MENLTFEQKVVVNQDGLDSLPGYTVVVFERSGRNGQIFHRLVEPGERFQSERRLPFWDPARKFFAVAVNRAVLSYTFDMPVTLDDHLHKFTLGFHFEYRVADPRRVAELREQDPLRRLCDEIMTVVGKSCAEQKWEMVRDRFKELEAVVLSGERAGLVRYAGGLGLEIVSVELDRQLPEDEEVEFERSWRQAEIDIVDERRRMRDSFTEAASKAMDGVAEAVNSPREFEEAFEAARRIIGAGRRGDDVNAHTIGRGLEGIGRSSEGTFKEVKFTAYYHSELRPAAWYTLLVYAHVPEALKDIDADSRSRIDRRASGLKTNAVTATQAVRRGAEIAVVPEMPGCRFNPPRASLLWLEDWHRIEFRMQADPEQPGFEDGKAANGRLAFYVGAVLIAELKFWTHFSVEVDAASDAPPDKHVAADPYEAVFVSYSHEDELVVEGLEKAYEALGIQYIRDVNTLRSGEQWNQALLKKIDEADIFQLCWSAAAKRSRYVKQEWRHALALGRPNFIRPTYWQRPMPKPPSELASLHFAYYEIDQ
jgi:TIR domain